MKKIISIVCACVLMLVVLTGCADTSMLEQERRELENTISELKAEKTALESEIVKSKTERGIEKYILTLSVKQTHPIWEITDNIKDSMNELKIDIPVDKEYFDSVAVGDVISEEFRMGSLIMHGSFGRWKVTVFQKEVV